MQARSITMLGTGLIGDFYTMTLHGQRGRDAVRVVYSRSAERGAAFQRALGRPRIDHGPGGGDPPPGDRRRGRRSPELHARGGRRDRRGRRQGDPVHEAARADRRGGEADARHGRARGRVRRLPRGPLLHAEDAQGDPLGRGRSDRGRDLGPLARDAPRTAFSVVLGRAVDRRRRDHRPRLPLHRDHPQLRREGEPAGRRAVPHRHARPPDRRRGQRGGADPLRIRARSGSSRSVGRSAAAWTCATRWPARTERSG